MKRRRAMLGGAVVVAWLVGLALLIRREYFRPQLEQLAEAATHVSPGAVFYGVMQGDRQIGFASSTLDTAAQSITLDDYLVASLPIGGKARRATARTNVTLTRALHMSKFDLSLEAEGPPIHTTGVVSGDSILVLSIQTGTEKPDTQRIALSGPILLPTTVPLAVGLGERPKVGKHLILPVFDPSSMAPKDVSIDVRAESSFVVDDSAVFDASTKRWHGTRPDTLKAWQLTTQPSSAGFTGWIDAQGRIVQTQQLGLVLKRLPYEVAFDTWRNDSNYAAISADRDILETTAIAADKQTIGRVTSLRVRLSNVDLRGFDLNGERQRLSGDTLTIGPEPDSALVAPPGLKLYGFKRGPNLGPEPMIQSTNPQIVATALRIRGRERDPRAVAMRLNQWVHDSIADRITFGVPNALQVLKTRVGDCNEHTQLFVALSRAVGIPARVAAGLAYVDGKFYYHAWPEILLTDWVAVDPTFGQFPADAAHLRFIVGGLARQTELLRLMGNLKIDVLDVGGAPRGAHARRAQADGARPHGSRTATSRDGRA
jgi:transglutaminase-like putative cysteine protease